MEYLGNKALRTINRLNVLGSVHMAVKCVIKLSLNQVAWWSINVYILGSVHIAVMCVIKLSLNQVSLRNINVYI
jgi:hypothetical protein